MRKISSIIILLLGACLLFTGCDTIDESDRLIDAPQPEAVKNVLLVDFTGQRCPNCPAAAEIAKNLKTQYGDNLVVVAIHGGNLAVYPTPTAIGLKTEVGDAYNTFFGIDAHPTGGIDWVTFSANPSTWADPVRNRMEVESPVDLTLEKVYDEDTRKLTVSANIRGVEATSGIKLLLWLTESKIIALQYLPNGGRDANYEHNHVFRDTMNGQWGVGDDPADPSKDMSVLIGEEKTIVSEIYTIDEKWVTENMTIVGFLYNSSTKEVLQVTEIPLLDEASHD